MENGEGYLLDVATINWFYRHYAGAYLDPTDRACAAAEPGSEPAGAGAGDDGAIRSVARLGRCYASAMNAAGSPAEHMPGPGMIHGFFEMGPWSRPQQLMRRGIKRFGAMLHE